MTIFALAPDVSTDDGVVPTELHASVTADNSLPIGARIILFVTTTATSGGINIAIKNQTEVDGQLAPDKEVAIAASTTKVIGPIPAGVYGKSDGTFEFTVDTPANISKFYAIEVP